MYKKRSEIFDCNFVYFVMMALFVCVRLISSTFEIGTVLGYFLNIFIQVGIIFSLSLFLFSYLRKQKITTTLKNYGFKKISVKTILVSFLIGILVYIVTVFIATFFSVVLKLLGYEGSGSGVISSYPVWLLILELFTTALLPGFCEEVANRGMLVSSYKCLGTKKAILLSGLLFGLMHLNINQFFYATILGFYFGFVALYTDSIFPTMIMHFTNNAISTFLTFAVVNDLPIGSIFDNFISRISANGFMLAMLILFVFIVLIVMLLLWLTNYIIKDTRMLRMSQVADSAIKAQLRNELLFGEGNAPVETENDEMTIRINPETVQGRRLLSIDLKTNPFSYRQTYKPTQKDMIFLYATLFLGVILTISTFIWGII